MTDFTFMRSAMLRLRIVGIVAIMALVMAACASGQDTSGGDEAGGEAGGTDGGGTEGGGEEVAAAGDCSELTLWHLANHDPLTNVGIEQFNEQYPDITVTAQSIENDPYKTQLQTVMGSDAAPDVFHSWGGGWLRQFAEADLLLPLNDYLEANPDWSGALAQSGLETATYDGTTYAAPAILGGVYFWYRTDVFEENGVEVPETWDEFLDVINTLNENDVTPITLANASLWPGSFYYMYLVARIGGAEAYQDAYSREGSFNDDAFIEAGQKLVELVEAEAFPQGFNGLNYDTGESRSLLWSGDAAMQLMGDWLLNSAREEAPEVAENNLDFFPFPAVSEPEGTGEQDIMVGGVNAAYSVNADTACPDAAKDLVRYLTNAQAAQAVVDDQLGTPAVSEGVNIEDPFQQRFVDALSEASYVQSYYDQDLPPDLAQTHLEAVQQLFALSITPEEAAQQQEDVAQDVLSE